MDKNVCDKMAEHYNTEQSEFEYSEVATTDDKALYFNDKVLSLLEITEKDGLYVVMRMNVAEGCALIDKYNPQGVLPKLVEMGRVIETRKGLYHVSEATRALLLEFDRETKADTCNAICEVLPLTRGKENRRQLQSAYEILTRLSDRDAADMLAFIRQRKKLEEYYSLKSRIERKKKISESNAKARKEREGQERSGEG